MIWALMAASVAVVLAFTLVAVAYHHLTFSTQLAHREAAANLAECAVARAVDRLMQDPRFGTAGKTGEALRWDEPGSSAAFGQLTFSPDEAQRLGIAPSLNNLEGDVPAPGWGREVPAGVVQLVGTGESGGVTARVEVLLHMPPYALVVGSSGPIETRGRTLVARVNDVEILKKGVSRLALEDLLPGALGSNHAGPDAVVLGAETRVTGDAQSVGDLRLEPGAVVEGEIRPFTDPAPLPRIPVEDYDPVAQGQAGVETLGQSSLSGETLSGPVVSPGDLFVTDGLRLEGGWLYVRGNLNVQGGISGKGAVFVTGSTNVRGGADLETDNRVALLSRGDVSLQGDGQRSFFRGLVYTEGDFAASDITLVGAFAANSPAPEGSRMSLSNAALFQEPAPGPFEILVHSVEIQSGDTNQPGGLRLEVGPMSVSTGIAGIAAFSVDILSPSGYRGVSSDGANGLIVTRADQAGVSQGRLGAVSGSAKTGWQATFDNGTSSNNLAVAAGGGQNLLDAGGRSLGRLLSPTSQAQPGPSGSQTTQDIQFETTESTLSLDFNEFLAPEDRLRVLLWRHW